MPTSTSARKAHYQAGTRSSSKTSKPLQDLLSLLAHVSFKHLCRRCILVASLNTLNAIAQQDKQVRCGAYHIVCLIRALGGNRRVLQSMSLLPAAWTALQCCSNCSSSCSSSRKSHRPRLRQRGLIGLQWVAKLGKGTPGECTVRDVWGALDSGLAAGPIMVRCMLFQKHKHKSDLSPERSVVPV